MTKSKNPCPVCGGREWIMWCWRDWFSLLMEENGCDIPMIDFPEDQLEYDRSDEENHYFDECAKCGTVVS